MKPTYTKSQMVSTLSPAIHLAEKIKLQDKKLLSPLELTNKRQINAMLILKQEEQKAVRSRLECLLVQQFISKFGSKKSNSELNTLIKNKVSELIKRFDNVKEVEAAMSVIELEVKEAAISYKKQLLQFKKLNENKEDIPYLNNISNNKTNLNLSNQSKSNIDDKQWPVINAILTVTAEQKHNQELELKKQARLKYENDIKLQIELNHKKKEIEKQNELNQLKLLQENMNNYNKDINEMKKRKEDQLSMERMIKLQQIEEKKLEKERERQYKIAQEQGEMIRAHRISLEEEEEKRFEKEKLKKAQEQLKLENERNKDIKLKALVDKQNYEKKLNEDYIAKLDREEKARQTAFQTRIDALNKFSSHHENNVLNQIKQQRNDEDNKILLKLQEADLIREMRDKNEKEKRQMISKSNQEYNIKMMEEKMKRIENEKIQAIERRRAMEFDAIEAKRKERESKEQHRIKMIELKQNLDIQIQQRDANIKNFNELSSIEAVINKSLIRKLEDDPKLLSKVIEKVKPNNNYIQSSRSARETSRSNSTRRSNL